MKNLLIISYDFPPSSVGIWRTIKFCRYMGEFGWKPFILTVEPVRCPRLDESPLKQLPEQTEIRRTESWDHNRIAYRLANRSRGEAAGNSTKPQPPGAATNRVGRAVMDVLRSWVLMPDDRAGWIPFALRAGRRWLKEQRFHAIYSTCFPHSAHVVGERLAAESGLPYLADFRDIWIGSYVFYRPATPLHDWIQRRMEARVIRRADRVVAATGPITEDFLTRYPDQSPDKFVTITNGFDAEDFVESPLQPDLEHFTITYAGTLYGEATPEHFFRAIRQLIDREPGWENILRIRFVGTLLEHHAAMVDRFGLSDITRIEGYLPHRDALRAMAEADALLLIVAPILGSHIMLTQKVFEYVAARRPVLGLVPHGAARDFLTEINEGPIVPPDDSQAIAAAIRGMLVAWQCSGRTVLPDNPKLAPYARRSLTRRLCQELDAITIRPRGESP